MERVITSGADTARRGRRPGRSLFGVLLSALVMAAGALGVATLGPTVGGAATSASAAAADTAVAPTGAGAATPTTTTTAVPSPADASVVPSAASAPGPDSAQLARVMAIADESGWDWRGAGVVIHIAFHPDGCCHWGIYDPADSTLWVGPTAFANATRLRYVVLHEVAHAWQWHSGRFSQLVADLAPWRLSGRDSLEAGADCVATLWGARTNHYWTCPSDAQALMLRRLAGDWT
jgi:hypothetical protein